MQGYQETETSSQSSSERFPPATDGSIYRDPQPDVESLNEKILSNNFPKSQRITQKSRQNMLKKQRGGGYQENKTL